MALKKGANHALLDQDGARNLFDQIHEMWIRPEIMRRQQTGSLPSGFEIMQCLIRLPTNRPPVVEFNDEITWIALVKKAPGTAFEKGQQVFLHEVQEIKNVNRPEIDGTPVAFVYVFRISEGYGIVFDFTPNVPSAIIREEEQVSWRLGEEIARSLQAILVEKTIRIHDALQQQLQKIGLWAAPALLPYPISKIVKQLEDGDAAGAHETFRTYCTPKFIEELASKWWATKEFQIRKILILNALAAHKEGKYELSIHALLPQIEGIITDWVYSKLPESDIPWRPESKTKRFKDLVLKRATTFSYKRIVESTIDFIVGGPVLKTFKRWIENIDKAFPNRHIVEHGKYDQSLFTEENCAKLFLLIDTVFFIISSQTNT